MPKGAAPTVKENGLAWAAAKVAVVTDDPLLL
jgi:hypothetical protein